MAEQPLSDIAELLLAEAERAGATAADVVVAEAESLSVGVRLGSIEKLKQARQKHLGLRAFVGERSAVTSSADFSRDALLRLAADTVALARVIAADPCAGLPAPAELATTIPDLDLYDPAVGRLTPEQGVAMATEAERAAMAADARIANSEGAEFGASTSRVVYGSSPGFRGEYRDSGVSLSVVPVASENGSMQRDYWYSSQRRVDRLETPEHIGRTAAARALRRLNARKVETCEVPVVFDPEMAGGLLRQLAAAVSGYALYKGTSFLIDKLGTRIAPEHVTVVDDGTVAGGLGSKPFDGEGLPTRRTTVVDRGILASYLFDTYSARRLGARSTGNAARSVGEAPRVAPTNLFLVAGTHTPEAIVASVERGLYVTELIGFGVNPVTGDYSRGAVGLWIEGGALAYPVEEITIAGNLLDMFANIDAVGTDLEMRHAVSAPTIRIARMTVAGG
ncbi:TldD/PmbA family protein [Candidatus Binatia bacterium]|nr:TldD/PmbA family protein [Candidatus Binatia bacterium]